MARRVDSDGKERRLERSVTIVCLVSFFINLLLVVVMHILGRPDFVESPLSIVVAVLVIAAVAAAVFDGHKQVK